MVSNQDPVLLLLREACTKRVFPGAMLCASRQGAVRYSHAVGAATLFPIPLPLVSQALFDVASLTKPVATTAAVMLLVDTGLVDLDAAVATYLPAFHREGKQAITVRHLLAHASGLPAHIRFYEQLHALRSQGDAPPMGPESVDWVIQQIVALDCPPPEQETVYSDLGFIVLGRMIERITEQPLATFCREQIFLPLGMEDTFFLPLFDEEERKARKKGRQIVVTEQCPWRGRLLRGEVHDDNCHAMGGVAGHAGLFSTAADLHRFGHAMLQSSKGNSSFCSPSIVREFWRIQDCVPHSTRTLGWDTRSPEGSQSGKLFSANTVGHLGFTGCSLWIDRDEDIIVVLLTNRVHPQRDNDAIKQFRPLFHDAVHSLLTRPAPLPPPRTSDENAAPQTPVPSPAERPVLHPPPRPASMKQSLTPPERHDDDDDEALLPQDEFATSIDIARHSSMPLDQDVEDAINELHELDQQSNPRKPNEK